MICTTTVDLSKEVERGRFREDLYYRLHVLPLEVPPLRERPEDILQLAATFLARFSTQAGIKLTFAKDTRSVMMAYQWPGNVTELRAAVRQAVLVADRGEEIQVNHLLFGPAASQFQA